MAFSMLPLLQRLPRYQLRDYLASLDPSLRQLVPWRLPDRVRVPMLRDAIDALPEAQRGRIHDDFEHVSHLASDFGQCGCTKLSMADQISAPNWRNWKVRRAGLCAP